MTKKDFKTLAIALNKRECENMTSPFMEGLQQVPRHQLHSRIVKRIIQAIKDQQPDFDSIKFMDMIEK